MLKLLRTEAQVPVVWLTAALFLLFGGGWLAAAANSTGLTLLLFAWLFVAIMWGAFGVVRHAEHLAEELGEPYGTLILTMSVTIIEVAFIITAVATSSGSTPVARDAVFAVVMIMLNGAVGLCLLLGGLRHHEQNYNLPGARAFLSVAIPLAIFALVMPNFTSDHARPGAVADTQAITIAVLTLALYGVFLAMQTRRHSQLLSAIRAAPSPAHCRKRRRKPRLPAIEPGRVSQRRAGAHVIAGGLSDRGARPHRRARRGRDRRAGCAGWRDRRGAGAGARSHGRAAGGAPQSAAARGQHRARLGAGDHRADNSRRC